MSFAMFDQCNDIDAIILKGQNSIETLKTLRKRIGNEALPLFLIQYIETMSQNRPGLLAIHTSSSIAGYATTANQETISRAKGFMGTPQLERNRFPDATHHVKIFYNEKDKAKLFYKFRGSLQFVQNLKGTR
jgi:hypothetical protein